MIADTLNLRPNYNRDKAASMQRSQKSTRHKGYLKDMLISKFLTRKKLDYVVPSGSQEDRAKLQEQLIKVQVFVSNMFDKFIDQKDFTQAKLRSFEGQVERQVNNYIE